MDDFKLILVLIAVGIIVVYWETLLVILAILAIAGIIIGVCCFLFKQEEKNAREREIAQKKFQEEARQRDIVENEARQTIISTINQFVQKDNFIEAMLFVKSERERKSFAVNQLSKYKDNIYNQICRRLEKDQFKIVVDLLTDLCNLFPKEKKFSEQKWLIEKILKMQNSKTPIIISSDGELIKSLISEFNKITMSDYINSLGDYSLSHSLWYYSLNKDFNQSLYSSCFDAAKELGSDKFDLPIDALLSLIYIRERYGDKMALSIYPHIATLEQKYRQNADKEMLKNLDTITQLANDKI